MRRSGDPRRVEALHAPTASHIALLRLSATSQRDLAAFSPRDGEEGEIERERPDLHRPARGGDAREGSAARQPEDGCPADELAPAPEIARGGPRWPEVARGGPRWPEVGRGEGVWGEGEGREAGSVPQQQGEVGGGSEPLRGAGGEAGAGDAEACAEDE